MLYGCVTWSPRACHHDRLRRAHHSSLTRCIGWRKNNRANHSIFYLDTLVKTGNESIEATLRRRRILFGGFVARTKDTRLSKCVMFGELVGGADCAGGQIVDGMFPGRPQSFRYQRRPVDGGTRGGMFHGVMDRWRESQGWTTACSIIPEHDGKDQGEDIPKQAGSCWFARHS